MFRSMTKLCYDINHNQHSMDVVATSDSYSSPIQCHVKWKLHISKCCMFTARL